jgi:hypothetical protein
MTFAPGLPPSGIPGTTAAPPCAAASAPTSTSTWGPSPATAWAARPSSAAAGTRPPTRTTPAACSAAGCRQHHRLALRPVGRRRHRAGLPQKLQLPRTYEVTGGAEREVCRDRPVVRLRPPQLHPPVRDQRDQPDLDPSGTRWPGTATARRDHHGPRDARRRLPQLRRHHRRLHQARGAAQGPHLVHLGKLSGTSAGGTTSNLWGDIPGRDMFTDGYLADDHRHEVKASVSYQATQWLSLGSRTTYTSGPALQPLLPQRRDRRLRPPAGHHRRQSGQQRQRPRRRSLPTACPISWRSTCRRA